MIIKKTLLAFSLLTLSTLIYAAPITGVVGFIGTNADNGNSLSFSNVRTSPFAASNTGTYAGLDYLSVTMNSLTYSPFYSVSHPLWSFTDSGNTYSFILESLTTNPSHTFLSGTGILQATGYDNTPGIWEYSTQIGLTFSSGSAAVPAPEPEILALLGLGLAGLGFTRRQQAKSASY